MMRQAVLVLMLIIGLVSAGEAATYFVSKEAGASNSNVGSQAAPWLTNTGAGGVNSRTFLPGDQILYRRGDTWLADRLVPPSSGSAGGGPITFGAYGIGAPPLFDMNNSLTLLNGVRIEGKSYLVIQDLEFYNSSREMIVLKAQGAISNITIQNNIIHKNNDQPNLRALVALDNRNNAGVWQAEGTINNVFILNNTLHDSLWNVITINVGTHDVTIEGNEIFDFVHGGIDALALTSGFYTRRLTVRNNRVENARASAFIAACYFVESTRDSLFDADFCDLNLPGTSNTGLKMQTGAGFASQDNIIQRMILKNNGNAQGLFIAGTTNVTLRHNTTYGWGAATFLSGNTNLIQQNELRYNNGSGNTAGFDGLFVNAAAGDFRLCEGPNVPDVSCASRSNAIDAGVDLGLPFNDSAPDLGALESGSVVAPTSAFINAGGGAFVASDGSYVADTMFTGGGEFVVTNPIAGTTDDPLYQSSRYADTEPAVAFSYAIPLPSGDYDLTLKFAESGFTSVGGRVFDVTVEGVERISNLDIFALVGANAAYDVTLPVTLTDGTLNIVFVPNVDAPQVNAIKVVPATAPPPEFFPLECCTEPGCETASNWHTVTDTPNVVGVSYHMDTMVGMGNPTTTALLPSGGFNEVQGIFKEAPVDPSIDVPLAVGERTEIEYRVKVTAPAGSGDQIRCRPGGMDSYANIKLLTITEPPRGLRVEGVTGSGVTH